MSYSVKKQNFNNDTYWAPSANHLSSVKMNKHFAIHIESVTEIGFWSKDCQDGFHKQQQQNANKSLFLIYFGCPYQGATKPKKVRIVKMHFKS